MSIQIKGARVLITGANRGIGRQFVEAALQGGADKVYAAVRDVTSVGTLTEVYGDRVIPVPFDLTQPDTIQAAAKLADDVNIVINNAGVLRTSEALSPNALDDLAFEIDANVYGLLRTASAFAPVLARNGGGAFVQLNSVVSMKAFPEFATYSASKAAAYSLTQSLKWQLADQGTQVFSVHPGPIATDMGSAAGLDEVAEPASVVSDALLRAFESDEFHVWGGTMATQLSDAYEPFARNVVEVQMSEG